MGDLKDKKIELISINELLADTNCFRIPDYQRGYAWSSQVEDLWEDIIRILKNGGSRKHYTGMLSLKELNDNEKQKELLLKTNAFYVVDGQQRLTSIVIILKSLYEYIEEECNESLEKDTLVFNKCTYRFDYSCDRSDNKTNYFVKRIYNGEKDNKCIDQYLKNIDNAKKYIDSKLLRYSGEDAKKILNIVLNQIVFNMYFIDEEFDVRVTFETMNTRGKRLSNLELLKNRLMYLTTLFNNENNPNINFEGELKSSIDTAWKDIYENIYFKKNQYDDRIDDDVYLQAHWIVYNSLDKSKGNTYIRDILDKSFAIDDGDFYNLIAENNYDGAYDHIKKYVDSLSKYSKYWKIINSSKDDNSLLNLLTKDEIEWLDKLNRITSMKYVKPVIMVIAGENDLTVNHKIKFYKMLERNLFINKLLAHNKNDYSSLITKAGAILNPDYNLDNNNDKEKIKELKLKKYNELCNLLTENKEISCENIENAIKKFGEYILEKNNYYYGWDGISYFLYEYNEYLNENYSSKNDTKKTAWNDCSIEHILPQKPTREYWKIILKNIKDENMINEITNSLGNLLLLSTGENIKLQNYSFPTKREQNIASNKYAYKFGSRSAQEVSEKPYWSLEDIYERQIKLFEFMYNRWINKENDDNNKYTSQQMFEALIKDNNLLIGKNEKLTETDKVHLDKLEFLEEKEEVQKYNWVKKESFYSGIDIYFDRNYCRIQKNSSNIQYIENKFTFIENGENLKCGIKIDDDKYLFEYDYESGIMKVYKNWALQVDEENLDEKLKYFIRTLNRYLRREKGKSNIVFANDNS